MLLYDDIISDMVMQHRYKPGMMSSLFCVVYSILAQSAFLHINLTSIL